MHHTLARWCGSVVKPTKLVDEKRPNFCPSPRQNPLTDLRQAWSVAPEQIWKWGGAPVRSESGEPIRRKFFFFGRAPPRYVMALKAQLVVLVSAFVMVSTLWSVYCLLFFYSRCPPCPAICKSGEHVPPCSMESAPPSMITSWTTPVMQNFVAINLGVSASQIRDFAVRLRWLVFTFVFEFFSKAAAYIPERIFTQNTSNDVIPARNCLLWVLLTTLCIWTLKLSKNRHFGDQLWLNISSRKPH